MRQALGLAVSGTEVRLAHLVSHKGQIRIEGLERARLRTTLEYHPPESESTDSAETEPKDAFGLKEAAGEKGHSESGSRQDGANLEVLYRLLEKYTRKRTKIAFNIPLSMANYHRQDGPFAAAMASDKDSSLNLGHEILKSKDGSALGLAYEKHPPTLSLLREVNGFVRGNLYLALMDTTELALANIARNDLTLAPEKITTIIYIEDDFTRLIFLRGQDLFHVSSIIHENATSPDILEVIYRKLIYELDEAQIPEISLILLAGKSSRLNAGDFFASHFNNVTVRYLSSKMLGDFPANEAQRQMFSEFAVPIALAWKLLEPKNPAFIPLNLLPQELLDQQQVLKLAYHGYALLAITGLAAFFLTWHNLKLRGDIGALRSKNAQLELQIQNNQATVDRVLGLEDQCKRLSKNLALADSLSKGHNELFVFLQKLNTSVEKTNGLWVDEILKHGEGFSVKGTSLNREEIPRLAEKLERASLSKVTRTEGGKRKLFRFELERFSTPDQVQFSEQGISIIDTDEYTRGGNLVLVKEGARSAAAPASAAGTATLPSAADRNQSPRLPRPLLDHEIKDRDVDTQNRPSFNVPIVKQASSTQLVVEQPPRDKKNEPDYQVTPAPAKPKPDSQPRVDRMKLATNVSPVSAKDTAPASRNGNHHIAVADPAPVAMAPASPKVSGSSEAGRPQPTGNDVVSKRESWATVSPAETAGPMVSTPERYRGYTIEAATIFTKDLAEQLAVAYRKQGYDAAAESYYDERTKTKRYRVLIGIFSSRPAAEKKAAEMAGLLMKDYRIIGLK